MGSVIRVLAEQRIGAEQVEVRPTWRARSRLGNLPLALSQALTIARLKRSDVLHFHLAENGALIREGALVLLARLLARPRVVTIHGSGFLRFARRRPWLVALVLRRASVITCLDRDVLAMVRRLAPAARVELVPNPVASEEHPSSAADSDELVLFAGLVGLRKGADVLALAWPLVLQARPVARLIVVGPRGDFALPEMPGVTVGGAVGPSEIHRLLARARVVALPSRAEGMPMILTEAMSAGRPFVSTPVGGIAELAERGGVLVEVGDHRALAGALIELLGDRDKAARIGERGRRFCAETRGAQVLDARFAELYAEALKRATRRSPSR